MLGKSFLVPGNNQNSVFMQCNYRDENDELSTQVSIWYNEILIQIKLTNLPDAESTNCPFIRSCVWFTWTGGWIGSSTAVAVLNPRRTPDAEPCILSAVSNLYRAIRFGSLEHQRITNCTVACINMDHPQEMEPLESKNHNIPCLEKTTRIKCKIRVSSPRCLLYKGFIWRWIVHQPKS